MPDPDHAAVEAAKRIIAASDPFPEPKDPSPGDAEIVSRALLTVTAERNRLREALQTIASRRFDGWLRVMRDRDWEFGFNCLVEIALDAVVKKP